MVCVCVRFGAMRLWRLSLVLCWPSPSDAGEDLGFICATLVRMQPWQELV